eukprot:c11600_g2_i3.p1 GENE.c11600_g2_i3~~c11600_g2_i3.p1  ORF type:complete len:119 (-),score=27.58 c11600_g2_i3:39-395(-)
MCLTTGFWPHEYDKNTWAPEAAAAGAMVLAMVAVSSLSDRSSSVSSNLSAREDFVLRRCSRASDTADHRRKQTPRGRASAVMHCLRSSSSTVESNKISKSSSACLKISAACVRDASPS